MKLYIMIFVLLVSGIACSDFLDVQPKDKQSEEQLFSTRGGYYTALNGVYNQMASNALYGRNLSYEFIDMIAFRHAALSNNTYLTALVNHTYTDASVVSTLDAIWTTAYNTILNGNVILKNLEASEGILSEEERKVMRGELLALRAYLHLDLLRLFGPIYKTNSADKSISYNLSAEVSALPVYSADSIMLLIMKDINEAEQLMAGNDPVIENGPMASMGEDGDVYLRYRQLRLNYYAVLALKARAALYAGDKETALTAAKKLLNDAQFMSQFPAVDPNRLLANTTNPDRIFSTEVLAGLYKKDRGDIFTYTFSSENAGDNFLQPYKDYVTSRLFTSGTGDYRYQTWWRLAAGIGAQGHEFIKYQAIKKQDENNDYFYALIMPLLRLSEMYYIATECEPDIANRYDWLNQIREKRGLAALPLGDETTLINELRMEYTREFYGEGQLFYYYKRMALEYVNNTETGNAYAWGYLNYYENCYVLPMPQSEMENR